MIVDAIGPTTVREMLLSLAQLTALVGEYRQRVMTGQITGNLIEGDAAPYFKGLNLLRMYYPEWEHNPELDSDDPRSYGFIG